MKTFSLKTITTAFIAAAITVFASALSAQAVAALTVSTTTFGTNAQTPNGMYAELTGTTLQSTFDTIVIGPSGSWTNVGTCPVFGSATSGNEADCGISSITINGTASTGWKAYLLNNTGPEIRLAKTNAGTGFNSGDAIKVTFSAGAWTTPGSSSTDSFTFQTMYNGGGTLDTASVSLTVGTPSATVTFDANGGSGAMANQTASTTTALSTNAFTRSGYTFSGWNTVADGSGTSYADGASYPFTASATLYAVWTADSSSNSSSTDSGALATTGFDGAPYLFSGLGLAAIGGAFLLIARRKQNG